MKLNNIHILKGMFPEDTGHVIKEKVIRFAHIDVDVYQSAKDIFNYIWSKVVIGGIIVFDDYGFPSCSGITKFINEIKNDNDKILIYNLTGQAILIKRK